MSMLMPHILMKIDKQIHTIPATFIIVLNHQTLQNTIVASYHPIVETVYYRLQIALCGVFSAYARVNVDWVRISAGSPIRSRRCA